MGSIAKRSDLAPPIPQGLAASGPGAARLGEAPSNATLACARHRPGTGPARISAVRQGGALALVRQGAATLAYVADEDDSAIHTVDIDNHRELAVTALTGAPSALLVLADGPRRGDPSRREPHRDLRAARAR